MCVLTLAVPRRRKRAIECCLLTTFACAFAARPHNIREMPNRPVHLTNVVRASHLILTGYGHWLPNDPRGSGSTELRKLGLQQFGEIHHGRKRVQPPRSELRAFYRAAEPALKHDTIWFDESHRIAIAINVCATIKRCGYTLWAFAVLRNHIHLLLRTHRDDSLTMLCNIAEDSHDALHERRLAPVDHPVWSARPHKVYLKTSDDLRGRIKYVNDNPMKEGLPPQRWDFVTPF